MKLPCEECVKTSNHCCKADIPYNIVDALHIKYLLLKGGFYEPHQIFINPHPNNTPEVFCIFNITDIEPESEIDIQNMDCVAFRDGKCLIYDDRPNICRQYGTEFMRCRFEVCGDTTKETIGEYNKEQILELDKVSFMNSCGASIQPYNPKE